MLPDIDATAEGRLKLASWEVIEIIGFAFFAGIVPISTL
jgi:hypothetical protein